MTEEELGAAMEQLSREAGTFRKMPQKAAGGGAESTRAVPVLEILKHRPATIPEMMAETGFSKSSLQDLMGRLRARGAVTSTKLVGNNPVTWSLKQ